MDGLSEWIAFEAQVTGSTDAYTDQPLCGLPVSQQVTRLHRELERRGKTGFVVLGPDLYDLDGADRDAALDALVAGKPSPYVLVGGRLVCTGSVEVDAVLAEFE